MNDPYQTLGVTRSASASEIKRAYRKLAKDLHPDVNPDDKKVAERFKDVSAAYNLLGDKEKRARFDRGEIDAQGNERGPRFQHAGAGGDFGANFGGRGNPFGGNPFGGAEDLFSSLFTGRRGGRRSAQTARGPNLTYAVEISFLDATKGGKRRVTLADGKTLDINIPAGIDEGQTIRLKNQGGAGGGTAGDALLNVHIVPHPIFTRDHDNVHVDLPVTLQEAVLGAKIKVPTIAGPVSMTIPKGSNSGTVLRLKGRGIKKQGAKEKGDQYVTLVVTLPDEIDSELARFAEDWGKRFPYDVRKKFQDS